MIFFLFKFVFITTHILSHYSIEPFNFLLITAIEPSSFDLDVFTDHSITLSVILFKMDATLNIPPDEGDEMESLKFISFKSTKTVSYNLPFAEFDRIWTENKVSRINKNNVIKSLILFNEKVLYSQSFDSENLGSSKIDSQDNVHHQIICNIKSHFITTEDTIKELSINCVEVFDTVNQLDEVNNEFYGLEYVKYDFDLNYEDKKYTLKQNDIENRIVLLLGWANKEYDLKTIESVYEQLIKVEEQTKETESSGITTQNNSGNDKEQKEIKRGKIMMVVVFVCCILLAGVMSAVMICKTMNVNS